MQDITHHLLFSDTHSLELVPQSFFTSGLDTASLLSSDAQTEFFSGNLFSEVLIATPVPSHIRLPECYTAEHTPTSRKRLQTSNLELKF